MRDVYDTLHQIAEHSNRFVNYRNGTPSKEEMSRKITVAEFDKELTMRINMLEYKW
jgi:hypothetical protein